MSRVREVIRKETAKKSQSYGFDFENDKPFEGNEKGCNYQVIWEKIEQDINLRVREKSIAASPQRLIEQNAVNLS